MKLDDIPEHKEAPSPQASQQAQQAQRELSPDLKTKLKLAGRIPSPTRLSLLKTERAGLYWLLFMEEDELAAKCLIEDEVLEELLIAYQQELAEKHSKGEHSEEKA